jgi:hypothetical protein
MPVHARATHTCITEDALMEIAAAWQRTPDCFLGFAGGHAKRAEIDATRRVLLPLFAREEAGKLCEDVRASQVCVALVGNVLREIAQPLQWRWSRRRAAVAPQRSRRARASLTLNPRCFRFPPSRSH